MASLSRFSTHFAASRRFFSSRPNIKQPVLITGSRDIVSKTVRQIITDLNIPAAICVPDQWTFIAHTVDGSPPAEGVLYYDMDDGKKANELYDVLRNSPVCVSTVYHTVWPRYTQEERETRTLPPDMVERSRAIFANTRAIAKALETSKHIFFVEPPDTRLASLHARAIGLLVKEINSSTPPYNASLLQLPRPVEALSEVEALQVAIVACRAGVQW